MLCPGNRKRRQRYCISTGTSQKRDGEADELFSLYQAGMSTSPLTLKSELPLLPQIVRPVIGYRRGGGWSEGSIGVQK